MQDKDIFITLTIVKEQLDKGQIEVAKSIVNEKLKKIGLQICADKLSQKQPVVIKTSQ